MASSPAQLTRPVASVSRRRLVFGALWTGLAAPLGACGGGASIATFDLSPIPGPAAPGGRRGQLLILEPVATAPLDSDRVIVRPTPDTVATLKGAQWSDNLTRLVQTRLLESFENSHFLQAVGRPGTGLDARYALNTEIRRFDIDVGAGEAVVELSAKVILVGAGQIVAARVFSARAPGSAADGAAAATALDLALGRAMRDLVAWTSGRV